MNLKKKGEKSDDGGRTTMHILKYYKVLTENSKGVNTYKD